MRPFYVVGNLKMNLLSKAEMETYLTLLRREAEGKVFQYARGIVCPPVIHLPRFSHLPDHFMLGAQNSCWEREGAFTGETSPVMLRDNGVEYILVGHSERRAIFGETDEMVHAKVQAVLKNMMTPILCIGETEAERKQDMTAEVIEKQLRAVFSGLSPMQAEKIIIAYEPRWAIGTDLFPTTQEILQVKVLLRKYFTEAFDQRLAEKIVVIYGGSVKTQYLPEVSWEAEMDGVLVGRESLFPHELVKMMEMGDIYRKENS